MLQHAEAVASEEQYKYGFYSSILCNQTRSVKPSERSMLEHQQQRYIPKNGGFLQVTQLALGTLQSQVSVCTTTTAFSKSKLMKSRVRHLQCVSLPSEDGNQTDDTAVGVCSVIFNGINVYS